MVNERMKTPRGIRNNNPLNIRRSSSNAWQGQRREVTDAQFCEFETMEWGIRAALLVLRAYKRRGLVSIADIVLSWAPPSDGNNTRAYIGRVCQLTGLPHYLRLPQCRWPLVLWAMAQVECGREAAPLGTFREVYQRMIEKGELK